MVTETFVDCIPCVLEMADNLADKYLKTKREKFEFMNDVLKMITKMDYNRTAPYLTAKVMRMVKERTGIEDLYKEEKILFNREVGKLYPEFSSYVKKANDPIRAALKLSMAGNIIDSGIMGDISIDFVNTVIEKTKKDELDEKLFSQFVNDLKTKSNLLYLGDNTGEIVFDKLFIKTIKEKFPKLNITFVTRGDFVLNDITEKDAYDLGIDKYAKIINNGSDLPGTDLTEVSNSFKEVFNNSNFIISKGQGNFESLPGTGKNIYYLFLCKCELLQKQLNKGKLASTFISEEQIKGMISNENINIIS